MYKFHCKLTLLLYSLLRQVGTCPAFALAGGGFGAESSRSIPKNRKSRRKPSFVVDDSSSSSKIKQKEEKLVVLDRFGLPPPTIDDIFPPLPPATELIPATKDEYSRHELQEALNDYIQLDLHHFDDSGVEKKSTDEPMRLRLAHQSPPVLVVENFFTPQECQVVQDYAMNDEDSSKVVEVQSKTFDLALSKRTSTSWFAYYQAVPTLLAKANLRLGIPLECMEEPQIVRYRKGEEFSWHYDEVPASQLENGGQRVLTLLLYLNTVARGGGTCFRDLNDTSGQPLVVKPKLGSALLFFPAKRDGTPDDRTLHKGEIAEDEKWIIQMWTHQRRYTAALPPDNRQEDASKAVQAEADRLGYSIGPN